MCLYGKWKWKWLSHVQLFVTAQTVVRGILQARILEWVAVPFSRLVKNIENKLSLLLRQESRKAKQSKHKIEERN